MKLRTVLVVGAMACSPAQQAVEQKDGIVIAAKVSQCIAQNATQPGATAESVALACELSVIPDELRLLVDVYQARKQSPLSSPKGDASP